MGGSRSCSLLWAAASSCLESRKPYCKQFATSQLVTEEQHQGNGEPVPTFQVLPRHIWCPPQLWPAAGFTTNSPGKCYLRPYAAGSPHSSNFSPQLLGPRIRLPVRSEKSHADCLPITSPAEVALETSFDAFSLKAFLTLEFLRNLQLIKKPTQQQKSHSKLLISFITLALMKKVRAALRAASPHPARLLQL